MIKRDTLAIMLHSQFPCVVSMLWQAGEWRYGDYYFDLLVALVASYKAVCVSVLHWFLHSDCIIVYLIRARIVMA